MIKVNLKEVLKETFPNGETRLDLRFILEDPTAEKEYLVEWKYESDADYEEERRLFYVSMTRAKDILFLSFNRKRYVRGQTVDSGPSRFIGEIPSQYVRYLGVKKQEE